jgi:hypothetical protein
MPADLTGEYDWHAKCPNSFRHPGRTRASGGGGPQYVGKAVSFAELEALMPLLLRCAWCGETLEGSPEGSGVSHGICEPCARRSGFLDQETLSSLTPEDLARLGLTFVGLGGNPRLRIFKPASS